MPSNSALSSTTHGLCLKLNGWWKEVVQLPAHCVCRPWRGRFFVQLKGGIRSSNVRACLHSLQRVAHSDFYQKPDRLWNFLYAQIARARSRSVCTYLQTILLAISFIEAIQLALPDPAKASLLNIRTNILDKTDWLHLFALRSRCCTHPWGDGQLQNHPHISAYSSISYDMAICNSVGLFAIGGSPEIAGWRVEYDKSRGLQTQCGNIDHCIMKDRQSAKWREWLHGRIAFHHHDIVVVATRIWRESAPNFWSIFIYVSPNQRLLWFRVV